MAVFAVVAFADVEDTAEIAASSDHNRGDTHIYQILGTWAGTITFEAKTRGTSTWDILDVTNVADSAVGTTTTANAVFRVAANGLDTRARFSTDTSGAPQVWRVQRGT